LLTANKENKEAVAFMTQVDAQTRKKYGLSSWRELPLNSLENVLEKLREVLKF
jgi:hypothetical protein